MPEPTTPLQIADYRRLWLARFLATMATLSLVVLLGYQVYDVARSDYGMSKAEGSFYLGLLGLVQFLPLFMLTPVAGLVADKYDRRHVVVAANAVDCCIAALLALLTWQGALTLPSCLRSPQRMARRGCSMARRCRRSRPISCPPLCCRERSR